MQKFPAALGRHLTAHLALQVGKTLPKAQNETNTTIKSRNINLPGQNVGKDKAGAAVTHRNLTQQVGLQRRAHVSASWLNARQQLGGLQAATLVLPQLHALPGCCPSFSEL